MLHKICCLDASTTESEISKLKIELGDDRFNYLLNQKNEKKYNPIHTAIFRRYETFRILDC
jgi:hypothetical protein